MDLIGRVEELISLEVGRGCATLAGSTRGHLLAAGADLAQSTGRAVLMTGFYVPQAGTAESDGPLGAVQLAELLLSAGWQVSLLTDLPCAPTVRAALDAAGCPAGLDIAPVVGDGARARDEFDRWSAGLLAQYRDDASPVTHMVAIERPGPARSGRPYNMYGEDIAAHTAPLSEIFEAGPWTRIAIGDGGNEIGMGALSAQTVWEAVTHGEHIHCVTGCDHLIVAGTSNWGVAGLVASLAAHKVALVPRARELLDPAWSAQVLGCLVDSGHVVDGLTGLATATVDGLHPDSYDEVLHQLRRALS